MATRSRERAASDGHGHTGVTRAPNGEHLSASSSEQPPRAHASDGEHDVIEARSWCFDHYDTARSLAAKAGFPGKQMPPPCAPWVFWEKIATDIRNGAPPFSLRRIVDEAFQQMPGNAVFAQHRTPAPPRRNLPSVDRRLGLRTIFAALGVTGTAVLLGPAHLATVGREATEGDVAHGGASPDQADVLGGDAASSDSDGGEGSSTGSEPSLVSTSTEPTPVEVEPGKRRWYPRRPEDDGRHCRGVYDPARGKVERIACTDIKASSFARLITHHQRVRGRWEFFLDQEGSQILTVRDPMDDRAPSTSGWVDVEGRKCVLTISRDGDDWLARLGSCTSWERVRP